MDIDFGRRRMEYPSTEMGELRDSNDLLGDPAALHARLGEDGYLLLRQLIDPEKVMTARRAILNYMAEREGLEPGSRPLEGVMGEQGKGVGMMGRRDITHCPEVKAVLEADELKALYESFFGEPSMTFDYKWLRAVGNEEYTGAHYDNVYMGRGSERLMTCWVPFGHVTPVDGSLAMCVGSHSEPGFQRLRDTYGQLDVDRDNVIGGGWFTKDPMEITETFGGRWATTSYAPGDIMTFGMFTMHASTTNLTDRWRISCDVRYQPASDPADERWTGEAPLGHTGMRREKQGERRTLDEARAEWGV